MAESSFYNFIFYYFCLPFYPGIKMKPPAGTGEADPGFRGVKALGDLLLVLLFCCLAPVFVTAVSCMNENNGTIRFMHVP